MEKLIACVNDPGGVHRCEARKIHKYGDVIWVRERLRLIRYAEGNLKVLVICEDIPEAHLLSEQLEYQAKHDSLTGLINRAEFERRLRRILSKDSYENECVLCYLDLDQFKVINDTYGHLAGDESIRQISDLFTGIVRKRDTLARLWGDEFTVLMWRCTISQATRLIRELLLTVRKFKLRLGRQAF